MAFINRDKSAQGPVSVTHEYDRSSAAPAQRPVTLAPRQTGRAKFIGTTIFAIFWNGIVSVFVVIAVKGWMHSRPDYFLSIFMIPFALIGLLTLAMAVYYFLALFNPRVILTLGQAGLAPGDTTTLQWAVEGRYDRIQQLTIRLEAREEATYTRGTNTATDRRVTVNKTLVETARQVDIARSKAQLTIPAGSMHSFESAHNRIAWCIVVEGDIQGWPDVKDEFLLTVQPAEKGRA